MPSSARALASGPASIARARGDLARRARARAPSPRRRRRRRACPRPGASSPPRFEAASECRPAITGPSSSSWILAAIEVASAVGKTPSFVNDSSAATESTGVVPIALAQRARRLDGAVGLRREDDEIGGAGGVLVRRALDPHLAAELGGGRLGALGVARPDHDVVPGRRGGGRRAPCRSSRCPRSSAIFTSEPPLQPPASCGRAGGRPRGRS